jgi:hypothetical protein
MLSAMPATRHLPPLRHWPREALRALVKGYRLFLSPWLGSSCRFEPTCSRYALQALEQHGAAAGSYLTVSRILRCHPWCQGGCDEVPAERPRLFRHLFAGATDSSSLTSSGPLP